jgi:hypothetical protein
MKKTWWPIALLFGVVIVAGVVGAAGPYTVAYLNQPQTWTVAQTFNPSSPGPPFILGTNAQGQTVTGLYAEHATTATNVTNDARCQLFTAQFSPDQTAANQYASLSSQGSINTLGAESFTYATWIHDVGTFSNLSCECNVTPGGGKSWAVTLKHAGTLDTPLTITLTDLNPVTDSTHSVVSTGDKLWDYHLTPSGTPAAATITCSLKYCMQ